MAIFIAFATLPIGSSTADSGISPPGGRAKLKTGDYQLVTFHEQLKKSQSLFVAVHIPRGDDELNPRNVRVKHSGADLELSLSDAWHDGFSVTIRDDGTVKAEEQDWEEQTVFRVLDDSHFVFGAKDTPRQTYEFIGNDEHYIAGLLLIGTYADDRGKIYVFGGDGRAIFPNDTFKYSLYLDTVLIGSDQFWDETHNKYYAFKRRGDTLQIVQAPEKDLAEPDWEHLLLSLHRVDP